MAGRARAPPERQLSRGSAIPRLLQPGRRRLVVGGPPRAASRSGSRAGGSTAARVRRRRRQLHGGDGTLLHNIYDRFRHEAFAEGEAADRPDQRVFLLCRSGAAGMQRFGATCWSGDINNDFATLDAQIPLGLNTGLSGVPYWGTDVGGFFHPVPETGELYARWFQLGAFSPIFRSHGWVWREHVPWAHGEEVEAICRDTRSCATGSCPTRTRWPGRRTRSGLPLMRPLVLNYPDDPRVVGARPRVPVGRRPPGRAGHARRRRPRGRSTCPRAAGTTSGRGARYDGPGGVTVAAPLEPLAAARARRSDRADGAGGAAHGGAAARRDHAADLSGGRVPLRAVRGRRPLECLSPGPARADAIRVRSHAGGHHGSNRRARRGTVDRARQTAATSSGSRWTADAGGRGRPATPAATRARRGRRRGLVGGRRGLHRRPSPRPGLAAAYRGEVRTTT